jgi:hypothetical protein
MNTLLIEGKQQSCKYQEISDFNSLLTKLENKSVQIAKDNDIILKKAFNIVLSSALRTKGKDSEFKKHFCNKLITLTKPVHSIDIHKRQKCIDIYLSELIDFMLISFGKDGRADIKHCLLTSLFCDHGECSIIDIYRGILGYFNKVIEKDFLSAKQPFYSNIHFLQYLSKQSKFRYKFYDQNVERTLGNFLKS